MPTKVELSYDEATACVLTSLSRLADLTGVEKCKTILALTELVKALQNAHANAIAELTSRLEKLEKEDS